MTALPMGASARGADAEPTRADPIGWPSGEPARRRWNEPAGEPFPGPDERIRRSRLVVAARREGVAARLAERRREAARRARLAAWAGEDAV